MAKRSAPRGRRAGGPGAERPRSASPGVQRGCRGSPARPASLAPIDHMQVVETARFPLREGPGSAAWCAATFCNLGAGSQVSSSALVRGARRHGEPAPVSISNLPDGDRRRNVASAQCIRRRHRSLLEAGDLRRRRAAQLTTAWSVARMVDDALRCRRYMDRRAVQSRCDGPDVPVSLVEQTWIQARRPRQVCRLRPA